MNAEPYILVVDDDAGPRETLKAVLGRQYRGGLADSADRAMQMYEEMTPDVVVTDVRMPGKDGIQLARELRQRDADVAIVVFTGHGDLALAQEGNDLPRMAERAKTLFQGKLLIEHWAAALAECDYQKAATFCWGNLPLTP